MSISNANRVDPAAVLDGWTSVYSLASAGVDAGLTFGATGPIRIFSGGLPPTPQAKLEPPLPTQPDHRAGSSMASRPNL